MNTEILNKYVELINKGYCDDCNELNCIGNFPHKEIAKNIKIILEENQELKKMQCTFLGTGCQSKMKDLKNQLEYLRSGEYLNQLKFERDMLQYIVDNGEVSKEDKTYIDCTHRNTELLAQQKEFIQWLESESKELIRDAGYHQRICLEILDKYKEIIGGDNK